MHCNQELDMASLDRVSITDYNRIGQDIIRVAIMHYNHKLDMTS